MSDRTRVGILILLTCVGTVLLVGRLFSVSVVQHSEYIVKAENQQNVARDILPKRGTVYVRDIASSQSLLVAQSVERFAMSVTPRNVEHPEEYAKLLAKISGMNEEFLLKTFNAKSGYMNPIMHGLTKEEVEAIGKQVSDLDIQLGERKNEIKVDFDHVQGDTIYFLGGTMFLREYQRTYPESSLLGQVLGFVNSKGKGQYGFEGHYDQELKGYAGRVLLEQDSAGRLLRQSGAVEGKDGTNYELSIDRNIQFKVEQELAKQIQESEAKSGSVIVMDPKTGEIIAMASQPTYDPNIYNEVAKTNIEYFDNPTISSVWEPGSIFKPLIMASAMDKGLVDADTKDTFAASVNVDGHTINTALKKAFGEETMTDVLVNSDNVAMVWVANKLGNQDMFSYLQKFGFGTVTGVDLANETAGDLPSLNKWRNINRATISFGQGIGVTPLQVTAAYASIANGGKMVRPRIVHAVVKEDGTRQEVATVEGEQVIKPEVSKELRDMLTAVVVKGHARAGVNGYKVAGKTGTAQVPDLQNGGYIADAYNHSFAGMAPADDPKYVMLVKIDQPNIQKVGTFAESTAVPLFSRISQFLLDYYQVKPTNR